MPSLSAARRILRATGLVGVVAAIAVVGYYTQTVLEARRETPTIVKALLESKAIQLELREFPEGWLDMLLVVEDPGFYAHDGMDLSTPGAGITTITQGMVKYLYFDSFRPGIAKLRQTLIAIFALDALVPKETQLLLFVNTAYLGSAHGASVRGFANAARAYLGKPFQELPEDEYLSLVAMIIAPHTFHVRDRPEANARRVARIKRLIRGEYRPTGLMDLYYGKLTEEEQRHLAPFSYFE